jgi:hypothetical protein
MLDQVFGGKIPTRIEGRLRLMRLTHSRALSTVAAPERSFGILKRGDRLSPKRRERRLDITGYIEGLLLVRAC